MRAESARCHSGCLRPEESLWPYSCRAGLHVLMVVKVGEREIERGSVIGLRFRPDPSSVFVHDPPDRCQSDSSAFKVLRAMEPLEYAKQLIGMLHAETDSVIANENHRPVRFLLQDANFNHGGVARAGVFDCVRQQATKKPTHDPRTPIPQLRRRKFAHS